MATTNDWPDLDLPLAAGQMRVVTRILDEISRMGSRSQPPDDDPMAEAHGPWGTLRFSRDGFPLSFRAQLDGQMVATLTSTGRFTVEGPVATYKNRDVPVVLGPHRGGVRFVAQGSRLRPAGRKRFLRVTCGDRAWTYGATQTHTDHALGKVLGTLTAATQLRRGPEPATGHLVTSWVGSSSRDEKDPSGKAHKAPAQARTTTGSIVLSWTDGTTVAEIVLTLLLQLGTDNMKLTPLWSRAVDIAMDGF